MDDAPRLENASRPDGRPVRLHGTSPADATATVADGALRVLLIAPPWFSVPPASYGGIEWVVAMLADGLAARGHDVTLLASGPSGTRARHVTVFDPPPSDRLGDAGVEVTHVVRGYRDLASFDVVHDHSGPAGAAIGAVAPIPVVHTLHGPWTRESRGLYRALADRLHLVAISHDQAARAPADVPIDAVVHNAIPLDRYPQRTDKQDVLAFVGRACAEKGPEIAVEVARRLGRKLVMCCKVSQPEERRYWDEVVAPRLHTADVEVLHDADHAMKTQVMGQAAALLFPIRWPEPFGLVMAEANACGTPVVAFRSGAVPEVLEADVTGRIVQPGDLEAFTAAVETVADLSPDACRAHVAARFSADRLVDDYVTVLRGAATLPSAAPGRWRSAAS